MCGIYGTTISYNNDQVRQKLKRIDFRGPDKSSFCSYELRSGKLILGHNRLAIIDLDSRSDQPFNYNGIHIAFNGEIYNFKSIKKSLIKKGHEFNTESDTEVVCAAYLEYGHKCLDHFNGMFSFVIYDSYKNILFGARDRLGQKPFYYNLSDEGIEFCSQLSPLKMFNKNLSTSLNGINHYLLWGNLPDNLSMYNEIKKLKAGHYFEYNLESKCFSTKQFWDIDYRNKPTFDGDYSSAKNTLKTLLNEAVKLRLYADVPVGAFLSGGIDSSLITALAANNSNKQIETFNIKFDLDAVDESKYAQSVAKHLKTSHNIIECKHQQILELIESYGTFYDEPFADPSAIPTMLLSKYTRKKVTVALSGDGGDEFFIGYQRYHLINKGNNILKIPHAIRRVMAATLKMSPNYRHKIISNFLTLKNINDAYLNSMTCPDKSWIDMTNYIGVDEFRYLNHQNKPLLERVSDFDIKTYLNWEINTKVDRATMAYSLEARSPFMDHNIVEFSRSLPTNYKFDKGNKKRIVKDVLYDYLPKELFDRPKAGFTVPFSKWFKNELKDYVVDELNSKSLESIPSINTKIVTSMIDQHFKGTWNRSEVIWKLLVLKKWLNTNT